MANGQYKNGKQKPAPVKPDDRFINDLIENRKRQAEALIKTMSSNDEPNTPMNNKTDSNQLIDKLIKKRKQENDAFIKLLSAIESKSMTDEKQKSEGKNKP